MPQMNGLEILDALRAGEETRDIPVVMLTTSSEERDQQASREAMLAFRQLVEQFPESKYAPDSQVRLDVRPGVARVMVGRADARTLRDFSAPLSSRSTQLASLAGIATVKGRAEVTAADAGFQHTTFSAADIAQQRARTVQSRAFASGAVTSLLQRLDLEVTALGLGVNVGAIGQGVGLLLTPLGPVLDGVLNSVLALLGLHLGEADVTVHGVSCPRGGAAPPVLVG